MTTIVRRNSRKILFKYLVSAEIVQKCFALVNSEQKARIGLMLENYKTLVMLLKNKNGTYVAQVGMD